MCSTPAMPPAPRPWLPLLLWLAVLVPVTAALFRAQLAQPVDPSNRALEAPGTEDDRNLDRLRAMGVSDDVVLLAFRVLGDLPILPIDRRDVDACRDRIAAMPGVADCAPVPDTGAALALVEVSLEGDDVAAAADRVVAEAERSCPASMQVMATGLPLYEARIAANVSAERRTIVPVIGLCLFAAAWLLYRRVGLALAALLPALAAIVWTSGLAALLGRELDPMSALLDPVLLTIGVATSVHFVEAWRRLTAAGHTGTEAARLASRQLRAPTILATATTMLGMLSLTVGTIPAVVDFGIQAAFGIALLHTFVFTWLPRLLAVQRPERAPRRRQWTAAGRWVHTVLARRAVLAAATVAVTVLAAAGLPRLSVDNDPLTVLPAEDARRQDHDALVARLGGAEAFYLYAPPDSPATQPERMLPFVAAAQLVPGVAGIAGAPLRGPEGDVAVPLLLAPGGSATRHRLFDDLERAAEVAGLDGLAPAGATVQMARDSNHLIAGLASSTAVVFLLLVVGVAVGLRSLWLGIVGALPMLLACVWIYGGMGWASHPVSVATGMIGCTMLGLIVDNALHMLHHYRRFRLTLPARRAVTLTLQHVGRPICVSSGLLILGFAAASTSRLGTTVEFSLLACSAIAIALLGCVVAVPLALDAEPARAMETLHAL